jgi:hypothetical protein
MKLKFKCLKIEYGYAHSFTYGIAAVTLQWESQELWQRPQSRTVLADALQ